jgi:orotidine-5'-phosphate decarboxylase
VGLDPDPSLAPPGVVSGRAADEWITAFNRGIVEATHDLVCCFKPNLAFYEAFGEAGLRALRKTVKLIEPTGVPVLADAKRADIGNTSRGYAQALFEDLEADAATVNPYLGGDSLAPFFAYPDRGVFVLCKTSNPGSGDLQDLVVSGAGGNTEPLYLHVARAAQSWDMHGTLGLVVGATYPEQLARVREAVPSVPILVPGVGAQAGDLDASVRAAAGTGPSSMAIVNASRGVLYASRGSDWQEAARSAARELRQAIQAARTGTIPAAGLP